MEKRKRIVTRCATVIGLVAIVYFSCFHPRVVENCTVVDKDTFTIYDNETGYEEEQTTITLQCSDPHKRLCFRAPRPFGDELRVGDEVVRMTYRPGLAGPCEYAYSYARGR